MRSLSKYKTKGFTLIEILITLAIILSLAGTGFIFGLQQYRFYVLQYETDNIISMLRSARSRAMNNINDSNHGVYLNGNDYIVFQGNSYDSRNTAYDETLQKSPIINITGQTEIVFKKLRGDILIGSGEATISNGTKTQIITLNDEGRISR